MRVVLVHPSALMYSEIYLRLEPLGLERVAAALQQDGHDVRLIDLQLYKPADLDNLVVEFSPDAVGFSVNYLANVPEVVELAKHIKVMRPACLIFAGGHSVSFVADQVLSHADGAIDVILKGEGEVGAPALLAAAPDRAWAEVPGAVTMDGPGRPPSMLHRLDDHLPARNLGGRRRKYFIGVLDPAASIEFTRGCPWDCSFCSAWTFYGRSYRRLSPAAAAEDMARIREPGVFIVDDVAFIKAEEGDEVARQVERRRIRKSYYLETRSDVLVRNEEVFRRWKRLGLEYMFLGLEALDEEGLKAFRKRTTPKVNNQALELARSIGLTVAINIIADPDWDEARFAFVREWALSVPEIVNITVQTPYPGTETSTRSTTPTASTAITSATSGTCCRRRPPSRTSHLTVRRSTCTLPRPGRPDEIKITPGPVEPFDFGGITYQFGQANNALLYPGLGVLFRTRCGSPSTRTAFGNA
jgi:hopanoid C-3 methylase